MKKKYPKLDDNTVRVIKISKEALFEFIYESMLDQQEAFFDVDPLEVTSTFGIRFEQGTFIMCAYKDEDSKGSVLRFPEEIDLQALMNDMDDTTESMYAPGQHRYKDYTKEELMELSKAKL